MTNDQNPNGAVSLRSFIGYGSLLIQSSFWFGHSGFPGCCSSIALGRSGSPMVLPIRTDSPLRATPWTNWAILLANVAVFLYELINRGIVSHYALSARDPQLLHFFTYAFLHGSPEGHW